MSQARVMISGIVQGVGYRYFVRSNAEKLGLTGWVRNTSNGNVEAVFQSSASSDQEAQEQIEEMLAICRQGPMLSEVRDIEVEWEEAEGEFTDFEIKRD
jgi:acylphosphatase